MDLSKVGYVYVVQMAGHDYYKIGRTVNPSRRISQISPQMPGRLEVYFIHKVFDASKTEALLHREFAHRRLNGEWFRLDRECLVEIKAHLLCDQAVLLYQKIAIRIAELEHEVYFNPARQAHALYTAAKRVERRHGDYGLLYYRRYEASSAVEHVLDAETVQ